MPSIHLIISTVLLLFLSGIASTEFEVSTFAATDSIVGRLLDGPNGFAQVTRFEAEFRTSHANFSTLIRLKNLDNEHFEVQVANSDQITVHLGWRPNMIEEVDFVDDDIQFDSETSTESFNSSSVGFGDWHRLIVYLDNGTLILNENLLGHLPSNYTAKFFWNSTVMFVVGGGSFRGCLANVSLDGIAPVPLHSDSRLLNFSRSFISVDAAASRLPTSGPGCRQSACPCLPNGVCLYSRWDKVSGCKCNQGFKGERCEFWEEAGINTGLIVGATVGVIAILLLLIAALVAVKVVRDRRRDFGTYLPNHREISHLQRSGIYDNKNMLGMSHVMRPPKEEILI